MNLLTLTINIATLEDRSKLSKLNSGFNKYKEITRRDSIFKYIWFVQNPSKIQSINKITH